MVAAQIFGCSYAADTIAAALASCAISSAYAQSIPQWETKYHQGNEQGNKTAQPQNTLTFAATPAFCLTGPLFVSSTSPYRP